MRCVAPWFAELLPAAVAVVTAAAQPPRVGSPPTELAFVADAVDKRRHEFATGRECARAALARIGQPPATIGQGPRGEPRWPAGAVGSITHCAGLVAAAVARADHIAAIGIDAEPHGPLPQGVAFDITSSAERAALRDLRRQSPETHWDRVLFSAKEATYKAWYPWTGVAPGWCDVAIELQVDTRTFVARVMGRSAGRSCECRLSGRWMVRHGLLATAVVVAPGVPPNPPVVRDVAPRLTTARAAHVSRSQRR